jgi:hypothetical protein
MDSKLDELGGDDLVGRGSWRRAPAALIRGLPGPARPPRRRHLGHRRGLRGRAPGPHAEARRPAPRSPFGGGPGQGGLPPRPGLRAPQPRGRGRGLDPKPEAGRDAAHRERFDLAVAGPHADAGRWSGCACRWCGSAAELLAQKTDSGGSPRPPRAIGHPRRLAARLSPARSGIRDAGTVVIVDKLLPARPLIHGGRVRPQTL